jgi:hypothetical protein
MQTVITVNKLPGQALLLQFVVSVLLPAQGAPSVSGDGLSQVLSRVLVPPSQETETKTRDRTCYNPSPDTDGATCAGSNTETTNCNNKACPGNLFTVITVCI